MSASEPNSSSTWLAALRDSHQHLAALVAPLDDAAVEAPSYASEWSIAQVLSHLGSGAEIFELFITAGLDGTDSPGMDAFQAIWDDWNAKSPQDQARDAITADAAFVARLDSLDAAQRESWQLEMFGGERGLADVLGMRLGEHALHTWDIAVMFDPEAAVQPQAVELLIDTVGQTVARTGKAPAEPVDVAVSTQAPSRHFQLNAGDAVSLTPQDAAGDGANVELPAEAFIRLVSGRLDPDHTPPMSMSGVDVDELRRIFPGF